VPLVTLCALPLAIIGGFVSLAVRLHRSHPPARRLASPCPRRRRTRRDGHAPAGAELERTPCPAQKHAPSPPGTMAVQDDVACPR
jgi:hypothetical protein